MRLALRQHPDSRGLAASRIDVDIARPAAGQLLLSYTVTGTIRDLLLPPMAEPVRSDELWKHTCFEAFVLLPGRTAYYEFNFAPSTRWAAYRFESYRAGMHSATEIGAPLIEVESTAEICTVRASVELGPLSPPFRLGLSAVLEETDGDKTYWALAHPLGKPDFHHSDCFTHEIL